MKWLSGLKNIEVILVEQDDKPYLADLYISQNFKLDHVFAYNNHLFNRSWGFNIGFRHASGDVLAFSDSDIFMDRDELTYCFQECHRSYDAVNPYTRIIDLPEKVTKALQQKDSLMKNGHKKIGYGEERPCTNFCGGVVLFKRNAFERIGGFDERFLGWGGEDDAMSFFKLRDLIHSKYQMPYVAYHLWHERTIQDTMEQPNYQCNQRLLDEYKTLTIDELTLLCENSKKSMGNLEKYKVFHEKPI